MSKVVMDMLCEIISITSGAGKEESSLTNRALKRLRDKIVNFVKECQKPIEK